MPTRQVDLTPNDGMRKAAEQGLQYRREYGRGGTPVGIARARDIKNGKTLSPQTARRMKAFFDRHEVNRVPPSRAKADDGGPTNGWIAWLLWGGDAGRTWAEAKVRQLNAEEDRVRHAKRRMGEFTEEEKAALKVAMGMLKKMVDEEPVEAMEDDEVAEEEYSEDEERPYDAEGNKIENGEHEEEAVPRRKKKREDQVTTDEDRWINAVVLELRKSK